jgi:cell division protein FtsQ
MALKSKFTFKKILTAMVWVLIASGTVVLLVAAISKRNNERCTKVEINIAGVQNNFFIDKKDVFSILENVNNGTLESKPLHSIDLALMETELQKSKWIKNAELFFDNNDILQVKITEREPIARIFSTSGASYYLDSSLARLPLSDKFSARLPVFTSFPTDVIVLSHNDSTIIKDIRILSEFINSNPFWMAQIDQVDISSAGDFDLIPKLGNQVIHFGKADNYQQKFNSLLCFYKQVLSKKGWDSYSVIDAQFKGQIVGIRRDANEIKMDSLRSVQIMKAIIANAQRHVNDSTIIQPDQTDDDNINASKEVEDNLDETLKNDNKENKATIPVTPVHVPEKPFVENYSPVKKSMLTSHSSSFEKPKLTTLKPKVINPNVSKTEEKIKQQPKAVMPSKTDY